jgi:hypothetical protein
MSPVRYELGFISYKTTFSIVTAVKTSNLSYLFLMFSFFLTLPPKCIPIIPHSCYMRCTTRTQSNKTNAIRVPRSYHDRFLRNQPTIYFLIGGKDALGISHRHLLDMLRPRMSFSCFNNFVMTSSYGNKKTDLYI